MNEAQIKTHEKKNIIINKKWEDLNPFFYDKTQTSRHHSTGKQIKGNLKLWKNHLI